ncbi:hypothetical protein COT42_00160 [Candidatus Saganbacteria bacterium CG08_land_8_20_14_0_20_45_16]|uniref:Lipopolysaccharide heptosyltransferase II n=1 Tax=Candidatus Saganbacteria bacterium CG08_land_8_20_14_0_20_45_16 TaxID=2014293 RepID=A0A2H0Y1Z6_UNCSA|nr:MAG: hypothetical protein COT42_00160 [Candidatus Saganbacteria bacterium CG08_land_8_20_14_0_20_45_16]
MKLPKDKIKKILIVRPDAIGDLVLITPAIAAIRKAFPAAKIALLLQQYTAEVMAHHPDIDEIIIDKIKGGQAKSLPAFLKYVAEIRAKKFDLSIDFYSFNIKHTLLQYLARIPYRLGDKSRLLLGLFYNCGKIIKYKDYTKHIVELHLDLLESVGLKAEIPKLNMPVPEATITKFRQRLAALGVLDNDYLIGVHPGCTSSRSWDAEKYAAVIDQLADQLSAKVILTGGPKEQASGQKIIKLCQHPPLNLINQTTIPEMMALIKRLNIYIGADTGPTHIAGAVGTPVVLIILAKNVKPVRWATYKSPHIILYAHPQARCPIFCDAGRCQEKYCTETISAADVVNAAKKLQAGESHRVLDWQKLSFNTLIIYDDKNQAQAESLENHLKQQGYHAVKQNAKQTSLHQLLKTIETENILILHHLGQKAYLTTKLANWLSGIYTTNATIIVKGYKEGQDLLALYRRTFQQSLF